ncbi:amino acid adenylation domain-containing protein [Nocardia sp. NPDC060256]|uniref:non-ribosomal peptide synthetase n=1 Tax=unclassified Nocardia TaxID=2637762 RepID=UPI0036489906
MRQVVEDSAIPTGHHRGVLGGFDDWVAKAPDDLCVIAGETSLTYLELDRMANRMAWALRGRGVGPGAVVGLCLRRDVGLAVAVSAVIKAGAAYLPLEPEYPVDRIRAALVDSAAMLLLADRSVLPAETELAGTVPVLFTDDSMESFPAQPVPSETGNDDLLYVIYTSGSTGKPKGIAMQHGPQVRLLDWSRTQYAEGPRALQYFPITADVAALELLSAWWSGGCVVIATERDRYDITAIARLIREHRITKILLPVVAMQQLARHAVAHPEDVASLRELITTGDRLAITPEIRLMCDRLPEAVFDDHYGSTEVNVVNAPRLSAPAASWPDHPVLGRPLPLARLYVLDLDLNPVPKNVSGEIYVGGGPLAWGYSGRGALTAESFIPDPFGRIPGARLYRTGDLGRWRAGGMLEFLGRADFQIKLRGYRIEPGEIEARLAERDEVAKAAVTLVRPEPDAGGEPLLAAYVVPAPLPPGEVLHTEPLRDYLAAHLPAHMVPQAIVPIDRLPLTGTGKVDRARLPRPEAVEPEFVAPRDELESAIAGIWAEALGMDRVGVRHNFFWLGGHSLLVTRVVYQIRETLRVELPLSSLFQRPTVEALAVELRRAMAEQG